VTTTKKPSHRNLGQGLSIPAAAKELGWPEHSVRRAVDRGEIRTVPMAGLRRVPPAEIARLKKEFGLIRSKRSR
jgi:hypothetical protein